MQSWHDQGYFTLDLLMKRTQIDPEWISVGELVHRAAGPKIFLSPIIVSVPPGPPGLTRRLDNLSDPLSHQRDRALSVSPTNQCPYALCAPQRLTPTSMAIASRHLLHPLLVQPATYLETPNPLLIPLVRTDAPTSTLLSTVPVALPTPTPLPPTALMVSFYLPSVECS
jgi:hypothetical protein